MTSLTIYKASAGSGKTFRLAVEYIKLLIQNPMSYRTTLAVTFTNKATEEMKMRILSQLYGIWKQLPDSQQYMQKVCEELHVSEEFASRQAGIALTSLIHHYSQFHVETIDSFFQTVLRNLARELDLTANLRVELNDGEVEEMAVDQLIESLKSTDSILIWIMNFITANISDDKNWNVIGQIKNFGKTIFKDFYKTESNILNSIIGQKNFFEHYTSDLKDICEKAQKNMNELADRFFNTLEDNGLSPEQLKGRNRGIASYFNKLRGKDWSEKISKPNYVKECLDSADNWTSKTSPDRAQIITLANDQLIDLLHQAEKMRPRQWRLMKTAELTLRHLSKLRLLGSIEQKVRELNADANRFLLSDTQQLLHSLIEGSDSPFIFEKIGAQLEHVMIDEFQDTSTVQWQNFKVLLREAMSHGGGNLIVGDVKQSIYRWRSGDWRLLNDIEHEFPAGEELQLETMEVNYRSARNIVTFNNVFFTKAAELEYADLNATCPQLAVQLEKAYDKVEQKIDKSHLSGLVDIALLPSKDFQAETLKLMASHIQQLFDQDVPANKIAILVRTNKFIPIIGDYLMSVMKDIKLVSDEAFRLSSSTAVSIIILAMRLLTHPDNVLERAKLVKLYQRQVLGSTNDDNYLFSDTTRLNEMLPKSFCQESKVLEQTPLLELAERLYALFGLNTLERESAYVCTFFDCISHFVQENTADITSFLNEWDAHLYKKTIQSDEIDGIRIISIHKSKGLEFDHVIIPFCDWMLDRSETIWCKPKEEPFSRLPLVPVDYSSSMVGTSYEDDYYQELLQKTVDNLNLLYVGFTRASRNLFVIGRSDHKGFRSAIIEKVLPDIVNNKELEGATLEKGEKGGLIHFRFGSLCLPDNDKKDKKSDNVFQQPVNLQKIKIDTFATPVNFKQSNRSRDFIYGDDEESQQQTYIKMGNILHNLFSNIRTTEDIPHVLRQLEFEGVLYDDDISADRLRSMLEKRLTNKKVADWFSGRWQLFNECSILHVNPVDAQVVRHRPDRVMTDGKEMIVVDFKFGRPKDEHRQQVSQYMQLLSDMGYENVHGYLWYVYSNQIVTV